MKTYKYKFGDPSNCIRIGNLLDDMWQVHDYFHRWQDQRYRDGLPYAGYPVMSAHLTDLKRTTHPHWNALPSQAIQEELKRIHLAYVRFFKKLGGKPIQVYNIPWKCGLVSEKQSYHADFPSLDFFFHWCYLKIVLTV